MLLTTYPPTSNITAVLQVNRPLIVEKYFWRKVAKVFYRLIPDVNRVSPVNSVLALQEILPTHGSHLAVEKIIFF